jgi:hypothetical protein
MRFLDRRPTPRLSGLALSRMSTAMKTATVALASGEEAPAGATVAVPGSERKDPSQPMPVTGIARAAGAGVTSN